jgi:hypothetical protein
MILRKLSRALKNDENSIGVAEKRPKVTKNDQKTQMFPGNAQKDPKKRSPDP